MKPNDFKKMRLEAKLTQPQLGALISRCKTQIIQYEKGYAPIPPAIEFMLRGIVQKKMLQNKLEKNNV